MSWWQERKARKRREGLQQLKVRSVRTRDALRREERDQRREGGVVSPSRRIQREINRVLGDVRSAIPEFGAQIPDDLPASPEASHASAHVTLAQLSLVLDAVRARRPTPPARVLVAQRARILRLMLEKQDAGFVPDASILRHCERLLEDTESIEPTLAAELRRRSPSAAGREALLSKLDALTNGLGHRPEQPAAGQETQGLADRDDRDGSA
ncbi:MAG: hypothetical protein ACQGVK_06805 [Myxococcota bacterium]